MIARAMNTRPDERLAYRELAKRGARVTRRLNLSELTRLAEFVAGVAAAVEVDLHFVLDAEDTVRVQGVASVVLELECHRCAEVTGYSLGSEFDLAIVADEAAASRVSDSGDVLVVDGPGVSVAQVIEDELLLALPDQLCRTSRCDRLPPMAYPALEAGEETAQEVSPGPFAVLEQLKGESDTKR